MDSLRGFEDDAAPVAVEDEPEMERPPEIGVDERRMHVRAYNYWVSLLNGRPYPSIQDLDPQNIEDFGPHSVLIDFSKNAHDPRIAFLGRALRAECGLDQAIYAVGQVPSRSLLSRLTDHYLQIIANCAPIGFEAEFVGQRGHNTLYRGILMPLSSNGEAIDFIYGVINWKEIADSETVRELAQEVDRASAAPPAAIWADGPNADVEAQNVDSAEDGATLSLWPDASLADRLVIARDSAGEAAAPHVRPVGPYVAGRAELKPRAQPIVCICHHGARSAQVVAFLQQQGYDDVYNLAGGVDAWSALVDPSVPRY